MVSACEPGSVQYKLCVCVALCVYVLVLKHKKGKEKFDAKQACLKSR